MRIEYDEKLVTHVQVTTNSRGPKTNEHSLYVPIRSFKRPDITVNKRDSSGFRRPSAYFAELMEYTPPSVESRWTSLPNGAGSLYELTGVASSFAHIFGNAHATPADWENSLKSQALRSIKDQKVNLSMTLAFLPQTLRMIRGKFHTIDDVLRSAQKADWKRVGKLLKVNPKSTSSFYLEVLFGWLQLIRDTQGIVEELHRKCNKPSIKYFYGRARRNQEVPPIVLAKRPSHWNSPGEYTFSGDRKIDHRLVLIYKGEVSLLSRMSQLGLLNPAELLWDLVPWSWVVNMGTSIGDFVATLDATVGLTYLGGTYTSYSRTAGPITVMPFYNRNRHDWTVTGSPGFYEEMRFNRKVIDDKIDPFVLKNPFSSPIALTGAVIAAVVQRGRKATPQPPRGSTRSIYRPGRTRNLPPITYKP